MAIENEKFERSRPPLRERYLLALEHAEKALEEAKAAYDLARTKLEAYDLVADDLTAETTQAPSKSLRESEVEEIAQGLEGTFTHRDVIRVAFKRYGRFIDAASVRNWLIKIAKREGSPIELVKEGIGPKPSVFRAKKDLEVPH